MMLYRDKDCALAQENKLRVLQRKILNGSSVTIFRSRKRSERYESRLSLDPERL